MAKEKSKKEEENVDSVKIAAENFFKVNKDHIYTENRVSEPFFVSTGVIGLDSMLGGGVQSGSLVRLLGPPTTGKSSEGLLIIKNFLESRPKGRGLIVPTEARLTEKIKSRSGVKFVHTPEEWETGTCLILPMNIYNKLANFIWTLVKTNELKDMKDRENFIIMIDCMDYLTLEDDMKKEIGKSGKVAGPQYMTKMLWSKIALPFNAGQHILLATSQQSAAPKIDPYAKDPLRQGGSSGGTNVQYQASLVLDFALRYESDYILEDDSEDAKYDEKKNPKIGHLVKGIVRKSDNEKYDTRFEYAVKYGRTNGNSVWVEKDILDQLVMWQFLAREGGKAKGSLNFEPSLHKELEKIDENVPEKFRGMNAALKFLEENPKITKFLEEKFKATLC
jgi:hypothetical protein